MNSSAIFFSSFKFSLGLRILMLFLLKYSRFTMLCSLHVYTTVIQLCIYTYIYLFRYYYKFRYKILFLVLHSRSLLVGYFI